jgi:hypothetical protein
MLMIHDNSQNRHSFASYNGTSFRVTTTGQRDMPTKNNQVDIYIEQDMEVNQRASLVNKLEYEKGIISAWFEDGNHHRITIQYDPNHFSHTTLIDTLKEHGYRGQVATD